MRDMKISRRYEGVVGEEKRNGYMNKHSQKPSSYSLSMEEDEEVGVVATFPFVSFFRPSHSLLPF
jgi:hypothetical protein